LTAEDRATAEVLTGIPEPDYKPVKAEGKSLAERQADKAERLRGYEDHILEKALGVVDGTVSFADVEEGEERIPAEWIEQEGLEGAKRKMRIAQAAWLPKIKAPAGLSHAVQVATSIIKARSAEKAAPRTLNIGVVQLSAPIPQFDVIDVEEDG